MKIWIYLLLLPLFAACATKAPSTPEVAAVSANPPGYKRTVRRIYLNGSNAPTAALPTALVSLDEAYPCEAQEFEIYYATGKTAVTEEHQELLDFVSNSFARCALSRVEIFGHADSSGSFARNITLSMQRANNVYRAMAESKIDMTRVTLVPFGKSTARKPDGTLAEMNRKTVIRLVIDPKPAGATS